MATLRQAAGNVKPAAKRTALSGAEKARRYRWRKKLKEQEGLTEHLIYLTDEHASILAQRGLITMQSAESKAELDAELQRLIVELAEAAR